MDTKVKYLKGWLNHDNMDNPDYFPHWKNVAKEAKDENCDLVIFKIPRKGNSLVADGETIEDIEKLLQNKLGK